MKINKRHLVQIFSAFAFSQFSFAAQAIEQIPLDVFIKPDTISKPLLSPDGKHVALIRTVNDGEYPVNLISVIRLSDMTTISNVRLPKFERPGRLAWVSADRLAVSKATERGRGVAPELTGEIYAYDIDGKRQEYVFGYRMRKASVRGYHHENDEAWGYISGIPSNSNGDIFVVSSGWENKKQTLTRINTYTTSRKTYHITTNADVNYFFDNDGEAAFAYTFDDKKQKLYVMPFDKKDEWQNYEVPVKISDLSFITKTSDGYFARISENGGPYKIVKISKDFKEFTTVAEGDSDLFANVDPVTGKVYSYYNSTGVQKVTFNDFMVDEAATYDALIKQFPGQMVKVVSTSKDNQKWMVFVYSDKDPGFYFVFDRTTGKSGASFYADENFDPAKMAARQPIQFTNRDGVKIEGYLTTHPAESGKNRPLVVLPHGGPFGVRDNWAYDYEAQLLANRGYAVLQVNFRGSGGRGEKFIESGHKNWDKKLINDLVDGIQYAGSLKGIDNKRTCAFGGSYGAYASMMIAVKEPGLLKCVAGMSGVYDLVSLYENENPKSASYFSRTMGSDKEDLKNASPITHVAKFNIPMLIAHGGADHITPPKPAIAFHEALNAAGKKHEWIYHADEVHGFYDFKNNKDFYQRLLKFLEENLNP
ncbi:alpha/beta hydrolase family protein [Undibacterium squillarum]|uniref:Prolyl oligopeptidase n=1 Tax=Undibacterium squillarum TaxID=1131567 RepID=A0ABQ2XWU5_9BURK|nr:prolyl oligopeptidase family serine peptidase [Undibacterium squillarum]GGX34848.1 prolyl oligopeptidase [Undibacterium squillarum]